MLYTPYSGNSNTSPPVCNIPVNLPSPQYQTRGRHLRQGAGVSLCFFLPLSLNGAP